MLNMVTINTSECNFKDEETLNSFRLMQERLESAIEKKDTLAISVLVARLDAMGYKVISMEEH